MQSLFNANDWESQLISLYLDLNHYFYDQGWASYIERFSPNKYPKFDDVEVLSSYLFVRIYFPQLHQMKQIQSMIKLFLSAWFPKLPKYNTYLARVKRLLPVMIKFLDKLSNQVLEENKEYIIDSCPIEITSKLRCNQSKIANEIATHSYCASKQKFYYGIKLHILAICQTQKLPIPCYIGISEGSMFDIKALEALELKNITINADLAYQSDELSKKLKANGCHLKTPRKHTKGKFFFDGKDTASTDVSKKRQPIECLFAWLNEKTNIQDAHFVRSVQGLFLHVWGSLLTSMLLLFKKYEIPTP